jgi:hypothetical protein
MYFPLEQLKINPALLTRKNKPIKNKHILLVVAEIDCMCAHDMFSAPMVSLNYSSIFHNCLFLFLERRWLGTGSSVRPIHTH